MARNDIHSPKNFQPSDYEMIEHFGVIRTEDDMEAYGYEAVHAFYDGTHNPHYIAEQCDLCGTRFVHGALLLHKPSGLYITIGGQCLDTIAGFRHLTDGQKLYAAKVAKTKREKFQKLRKVVAEAPEGLLKALKTDHYISRDLRSSLIKWGSLSDKQIDLAFKIQKDEEAKQAEGPEAPKGDVPITDKRIEVTGTILGTKWQENDFGGTLKMIFEMELPEGKVCKLWGSVPSAVEGETKGQRLSFMARVEPSKDDPSFGFFKRPTKVQRLEEV